jgi:hypothetical protein
MGQIRGHEELPQRELFVRCAYQLDKGRDQRTKPRGLNPLSQLGVTYSDSGLTATLWEKAGGEWRRYAEIDGSASYQVSAVGPQYRGKDFNLAGWYPEYDWVADDGYRNFSSWVG